MLREVGDIARSVGARVLVDEVYLDAVYENTPRTSFHLGPEFLVTSSLTKVYGVSGLRCGWILAQPDLARSMRLLNDLFAATPAHPSEIAERGGLRAPGSAIRERARRVVEADRALLRGVPGAPRRRYRRRAHRLGHDRVSAHAERAARTRFWHSFARNTKLRPCPAASSKCPIISASAWA